MLPLPLPSCGINDLSVYVVKGVVLKGFLFVVFMWNGREDVSVGGYVEGYFVSGELAHFHEGLIL